VCEKERERERESAVVRVVIASLLVHICERYS